MPCGQEGGPGCWMPGCLGAGVPGCLGAGVPGCQGAQGCPGVSRRAVVVLKTQGLRQCPGSRQYWLQYKLVSSFCSPEPQEIVTD